MKFPSYIDGTNGIGAFVAKPIKKLSTSQKCEVIRDNRCLKC